MKHHYKDIRDKLGPPIWWDEVGAPRYCEFSPTETNDIYVKEAALVEISCQNCGQRFKVAMGWSEADEMRGVKSLADQITFGTLHYGDPPNAGCCLAGVTMNSVPHRVIEFWRFEKLDWKRCGEMEIEIECEWAKQDETIC